MTIPPKSLVVQDLLGYSEREGGRIGKEKLGITERDSKLPSQPNIVYLLEVISNMCRLV